MAQGPNQPMGPTPTSNPRQQTVTVDATKPPTEKSLRNIANTNASLKFVTIFTVLPTCFALVLSLIADNPMHTPTLRWQWFPLLWEECLLLAMFLWVIRLVHYFGGFESASCPSIWHRMSLFWHMAPVVCIWMSAGKARIAADPSLVWFSSIVFFRYWRTAVALLFILQHQPTRWIPTGEQPKYFSSHCTVIVPTKGPGDKVESVNVFERMVTGVLKNKPKCLIFSAPTDKAVEHIKQQVAAITADYSEYRQSTEIKYTSDANVMNKRYQSVAAWNLVETLIVVNADDTAIWESPRFLEFAIRPFNNPKVGLIGTTKWVERVPGNSLVAGFWNMVGNDYLSRHNFEILASFIADMGIFCVSGRTNLIRTEIVQDQRFQEEFLEEYVWGAFFKRLASWGEWSSAFQSLFDVLCKHFECITPRGVGPVKADDDNFITRWAINVGWDVAVESSPEAKITTQLGGMEPSGLLPSKYVGQCVRWSRTTMRQNPEALLSDLTVWMKWPITTWMTYIAWLHNAALLWDFAIIWTFTHTKFYTLSPYRAWLMVSLTLVIWLSKLIKTISWYKQYPKDIQYFLPQVLFSYCHSLIKFYTIFTYGDLSWNGREKDIEESKKDIEENNKDKRVLRLNSTEFT